MRSWVLLAVGCLGCASTSQPKPIAPRVAAHEPPQAEERRPYAELVRLPAATAEDSPGVWVQLAAIAQLSSRLPESVQEQAAMFRDMGAVFSAGFGEDVVGVVDLNQPVDIVMAPPTPAHGNPDQVMAFRVRSPDAVARGQVGLTLQRLAPGMWRIGNHAVPAPVEEEPEEGEDEEGEEEELSAPEPAPETSQPCLLAHAPEPVGFRVLCGSNEANVQRVAPFLLRPVAATTSDVHVEMGGAAYRAVVAEAVSAMEAPPPVPPADSGEKLGQQVIEGLALVLGAHDHMSLDVRLSPRGAEIALDIGFGKSLSAELFQTWLTTASQAPLPPSFALLPADSGVAFAFSGLGKEATRAVVERVLKDFVHDMADEYTLPLTEQRELSETLAGILPPDARLSLALGGDGAGLSRVLSSDAVLGPDNDDPPSKLGPGAVKALSTAFGSWLVLGVEASPQQYLPAVERMHRLNGKKWKRRPDAPAETPSRDDVTTLRRPVKLKGLPATTLHFVDEVRPAKDYVPFVHGYEPPLLPYERHWLFVPDGVRTWIVIGASEAVAGARALELLNGTQRLSARDEVKTALQRPLLSALWFSMAGWALQQQDWDAKSQRDRTRRRLALLAGAANGAAAPMLVTLELQRDAAAGGFAVRARSALDVAALTDVLTWKSVPTLVGFD